ncbi:hypothetical protein V8G54_022985 [Vigna mungo]|uniref:Uncharacterized protein n=1 Tax=Vigna mungo TaxID=3915 RepID=A0AAQ3RRR9_VIGMU
MVREVRESGSKSSSGKDSASSFSIHKLFREGLSPKAPFNEPISLEQFLSFMKFSFDGKPPSGNDSSLGQSYMHSLVRDGSSICIFPGNDSNLEHSLMVKSWR